MTDHSSSFRLDAMQFFGRGAADYEAMFGLELAALAGRRVLDCPSGPSSFVARLTALGIDAVGVDPLYEQSADTLRARGIADIETTVGSMRRNPASFADLDLDAYAEGKRRSLEAFLDDFDSGRAGDRYLAASLPTLPFADESFDLVVSAHLLFTYSTPETGGLLADSPFDEAWHLAAADELMRVARGELRLYPTSTRWKTPERHPFATAIARRLESRGMRVRYEPSTFARGNHSHDPLNACLVASRA